MQEAQTRSDKRQLPALDKGRPYLFVDTGRVDEENARRWSGRIRRGRRGGRQRAGESERCQVFCCKPQEAATVAGVAEGGEAHRPVALVPGAENDICAAATYSHKARTS